MCLLQFAFNTFYFFSTNIVLSPFSMCCHWCLVYPKSASASFVECCFSQEGTSLDLPISGYHLCLTSLPPPPPYQPPHAPLACCFCSTPLHQPDQHFVAGGAGLKSVTLESQRVQIGEYNVWMHLCADCVHMSETILHGTLPPPSPPAQCSDYLFRK